MIIADKKKLRRYCKNFTKVENYDKAIADKNNMWVVHHRDEIRILPSGMVAVRTHKELIEAGLYWHVPASYLVFMPLNEHKAFHAKHQKISDEAREKMRSAKLGKPGCRKGISPSEATREKLRIAQTGKCLSFETRKKISEANLKRWASRASA